MLKATKEININLYVTISILDSLQYLLLPKHWETKIKNLTYAMENELYEGLNDDAKLDIKETKFYITETYEKPKFLEEKKDDTKKRP